MMHDSMVKSITMYGAEIWSWKEQDKVREREHEITPMDARPGKTDTKGTTDKRSNIHGYERTIWETERAKYFERCGFSAKEIENKRNRGENVIAKIIERDRDTQRQEQGNRRIKLQPNIQTY
ncbi:hypothetical protein CBL_01814 [Carabus blaptoides fortunei]